MHQGARRTGADDPGEVDAAHPRHDLVGD
jgi:hypothetical protein